MSEPKVESVELRLRMDATITVNPSGQTPTEWIKPGAEASVRWFGEGYPSPQQVLMAFEQLQTKMIAPVLEELIVQIHTTNNQARRGER